MNKRINESPNSSSKQRGKRVAEANKRDQMNELCFQLSSIIPSQHIQTSEGALSQVDSIDQATNYIVELRNRVDNLQKRKEQLIMMVNQEGISSNHNQTSNTAMMSDASLPIIEVKDLGNSLEVQLVMQLERDITLHEVIKILEDEGADVVNVTFSNSGNKVFHTLHAKAQYSNIGIEVSRVRARLHELLN